MNSVVPGNCTLEGRGTLIDDMESFCGFPSTLTCKENKKIMPDCIGTNT